MLIRSYFSSIVPYLSDDYQIFIQDMRLQCVQDISAWLNKNYIHNQSLKIIM